MFKKKLIIGLAQSNKDYGFSKKKNLNKIIDTLYESNINELDTAPTYNDSHKIISNIGKKNLIFTQNYQISTVILLN
jgi:aryl-alcohol dehydrogenase-like predicted oxidoreductase